MSLLHVNYAIVTVYSNLENIHECPLNFNVKRVYTCVYTVLSKYRTQGKRTRKMLRKTNLLCLKFVMFCVSASFFSLMPFATMQAKVLTRTKMFIPFIYLYFQDLGISMDHIAIIYAILPFTRPVISINAC